LTCQIIYENLASINIRTVKHKNRRFAGRIGDRHTHNLRYLEKGYSKADVAYFFGQCEQLDIEFLKPLVNGIGQFFSPEQQIELQARINSLELIEFVPGRSLFRNLLFNIPGKHG